MPPDNDFETFSREFDRIFDENGLIPDGTIRTDIISPMNYYTATADYDGDWNSVFATPFVQYTGTGRLTTDSGHVRIQGLDLVDVIKQLSKEEKREVLKLLLEAFDKPEEEKSISVKRVNRLKEMLERRKKNDVVKSS